MSSIYYVYIFFFFFETLEIQKNECNCWSERCVYTKDEKWNKVVLMSHDEHDTMKFNKKKQKILFIFRVNERQSGIISSIHYKGDTDHDHNNDNRLCTL